MKLNVRLIILAVELLMTVGGAVSIVLRRKDKTAGKFTVETPRGFDIFFFVAGMLFSLPAFLSQDPTAPLFCIFSLPVLYAALLAANQRIRWDTEGFWYRTAFRREIRYDFANVRRMRPVGTGRAGSDLFVNVDGRRFLLDEYTFWQRFAGAYNDWRTRNQLPTWDQEQRDRFLEKYPRHGFFRKKLDRIPLGRFMLWLLLIFCMLLGTAAVYGIVTAKQPIYDVYGAVALAVCVYLPGRYLYAVAHLDDKPRLIRRYVTGKILPDPDRPRPAKRVYRKKK